MPVRVKICGVCSVEDGHVSVAAGADFLGLNFHPLSPRFVDGETALAIARSVTGAGLVGVFVDAPRARVEEIGARVGLHLVQFHGDEPPAYCRGWRWPVIKAIRPRAGEDAAVLAACYDVDYILLDSHVPGQHGGTGVALAPVAARGLPADRLFVAGGLTPDTVEATVRTLRPFAVDVASGVEERPGRKDHAKVEAFIRNAKQA